MRRFSLPLLSLLFILSISVAQAQNPLSAKDYLKRGNTRFSKSDMEGAMADYTKALEIDPQLAEAHLNRGKARRANEKEPRTPFAIEMSDAVLTTAITRRAVSGNTPPADTSAPSVAAPSAMLTPCLATWRAATAA